AAVNGASPELYQQSRGWTADDWGAAVERLATRGLVHSDGTATDEGASEHERIERRTDELAAAPYTAVGDDPLDRLIPPRRPPAPPPREARAGGPHRGRRR